MHTNTDTEKEIINFEAMADLNIRVLDALAADTEAALAADDTKALAETLRASGLALSNLTKLCTLKKRISPEEEEDDYYSEILQNAKERAGVINGKAKKD